ncbi:MAG: hypothetical protein BSOLF_0593 [Candidatus Carbobacillus altaicus]|uniref:Probable membrane transporter protein n=1 Tax=Candidatus Carbonibacillus altaicus TaxID=2163959 RepID=A0A2R6Y0K0_9BACL|nr:MAG: hypothetical protein BSOLF_0593 [Candidatus Carbobacillus altaicus]
MNLSLALILTLFAIGFIGSFISGLVGIGGSIIKYPLLLYIPPLLGVGLYSAQEVSGISAVQVFFATLSAVFALRKSDVLNWPLIGLMGVSIIIGSFGGAYGSKFLSNDDINFVYAVLASIAAGMMFVPKRGLDDIPLHEVRYNKVLASLSAFLVGLASGIVGAAGAFILVPVMLVVLKIPTRMTIATSLAVTFISSIGATVGKIVTGQVLFWESLIMVVASVLAAPLGARLSGKVHTKVLQGILAVLILSTAIKIWVDILG